jgi:pyruvate dehydrogenase E2 component (dihydrolipoamide acetyltransferase)
MPKLGMTMEQGTLLAWHTALGARVEKGAPVASIESEKAEVELEAIASGWLRHTWVEPGQTVPCGTLLGALTDTPDEPFDPAAFHAQHDRPQAARPAPSAAPAAGAPAAAPRHPAAPGAARPPVAPAARARARELGIEVERVTGTGPGGRVTRQDVEAWARARESLVEVGGGVRLEVPRQGQGDAVLLLPGFGTDVSAFARQTPALAGAHAVLGVNPRGVGLSDAPEAQCYDVAQAANDAAAVAAAVAGGPVHVVGTSLGAAVAIELALRQPQRVRSLALIAPLVAAPPRLLAVVDAWARLAARLPADELARALLPWLFSEALLADDAARERMARGLAQTLSRVPPATLPRAAAGLRAWSGTRGAELGRLAAPALVIAGGADLLTPGGEAVARAIPGARCVVIAGAGHAVGLEAPDAVNAALLEHLTAA